MTAAPHSSHPPKLSLPRLAAFAAPNVAVGAMLMALSIYLPRYYAGHVGLGLAAVGLAIMSVRLVDIVVDPLIGVAMVRTRTRFGRYRPWMAAGAPILIGSAYMLFNPPVGASVAYLAGWVFMFYLGISLVILSQYSWAAGLAANYDERSRVFGALQLMLVVGATCAILLPIVFANCSAGGGGAIAMMGRFGMMAAAVGITLALTRVPERIVDDRRRGRVPLALYWRMVFRPDLRRIIFSDFCLELGVNWMSALYLFYFHDALRFTIAQASILLLVFTAAGLAGATGLSYAATRFGKHRTLMTAALGYSGGLLALTILPAGDMLLGALFMFVMGFLASGFPLLNRAMVADVGDAVRLEEGFQNAGLLYAMLSTDQKIARALSIGLSFTVLGWLGYQARPGAINTPEEVRLMEMTFLFAPVLFVLLGGASFIGYKLNAARHAEIRKALNASDEPRLVVT